MSCQCEFQHSSSHGDCNFDAKLLTNDKRSSLRFCQDDLRSPTQVEEREGALKARGSIVALRTWFDRNSSGLPTDSCPTNPVCELCPLILVQPIHCFLARVPTQPSLESILALHIRHRVSSALASNRQGATSQCSRCCSLHIACFSLPLLPSWSTQFCTRLDEHNQFRRLSVSLCSGDLAGARFNRCAIILQWRVRSMVSRTPILQSCNAVVEVKQRLASFPHVQTLSLGERLDNEIFFLNSVLYSRISGINVRQIIRRRSATLNFNFM